MRDGRTPNVRPSHFVKRGSIMATQTGDICGLPGFIAALVGTR